jgi:2-polyprenyl-3-methyl-5-hydroxy-6-metoxy-1,4-benzoquinol methylase
VNYRVITDHPVALDSEDHQIPGGTMHDNSTNPVFNRKLYQLLSHLPKLRVMDLGCAGGGFVKSLVDDGHEAIGLEGSDYSLHWDGPGGTEQERATRKPGKRAEWATIPDRLFTCDITRPFQVETLCDSRP